jgi:hypothetical protein
LNTLKPRTTGLFETYLKQIHFVATHHLRQYQPSLVGVLFGRNCLVNHKRYSHETFVRFQTWLFIAGDAPSRHVGRSPPMASTFFRILDWFFLPCKRGVVIFLLFGLSLFYN